MALRLSLVPARDERVAYFFGTKEAGLLIEDDGEPNRPTRGVFAEGQDELPPPPARMRVVAFVSLRKLEGALAAFDSRPYTATVLVL